MFTVRKNVAAIRRAGRAAGLISTHRIPFIAGSYVAQRQILITCVFTRNVTSHFVVIARCQNFGASLVVFVAMTGAAVPNPRLSGVFMTYYCTVYVHHCED
jgi:hypothetical protein